MVLIACSITKMMSRSRPLLNTIFEVKAYMSTNVKIENHYEILNIPQTSTQDDIKSAYYELTKKYHPDKNTSHEAKIKFQKVSDAYEVLSNFAKRKQYDRDLMARGHRATVTSAPSSAAENAASYGVRRTVVIDPLAAFYKSKIGNNPETPIYNFDDWTRAHYGQALKKTLDQREARKLRQRIRLKEHQTDVANNRIGNVFLLLSATITLIVLTLRHQYEIGRYDRNQFVRQANEANLQKSKD